MIQLALSTSSTETSCALLLDDKIDEIIFERERTPVCEAITDNIALLLKRNSISRTDLELIGIDIGPGSFTGIRIGITTANALGLGLNIPVTGISTLDILANTYIKNNLVNDEIIIKAGINAGRKEVYTTSFLIENHNIKCLENDNIVKIEDFHKNKQADILIGYNLQDLVNEIITVKPIASSIFEITKNIDLSMQKLSFASPNYVRLSDAEVNHLKQREAPSK